MTSKKSNREFIIDSLTKSRDEIYAESSTSEKVGYWIVVTVVCMIIVGMWFVGSP